MSQYDNDYAQPAGDKLSGNIVKEIKVQLALGVLKRAEAIEMLKFMACYSEDQKELTQIFWIIVNNEHLADFSDVRKMFKDNENVDDKLQRYVVPLATNRPIPEIIEKYYPKD